MRTQTVQLRYKRSSKAMQLYEEIEPVSKEPYVDKREGVIRQLYVTKRAFSGTPPKHISVNISWEKEEGT